MPWLPIYANSEDFRVINDWINTSDEVAYIVPDGPQRWRAINSLPTFDSDRVCLWHVPSGPLPLPHSPPSREVSLVTDPWSGWQELRAGADAGRPWFGAGHPGIIWLNARSVSRRSLGGVGLSSFEWIGSHYSIIGNAALPSTERFWRSLRRWTQKHAKKIPRNGPLAGPHAEIFAFPSALAAFEAGIQRDENP